MHLAVLDYTRQKRKFDKLFSQLDELEKPYLIAEVMESEPHLADRLYREALRISNRSVIENGMIIEQIEDKEC